MNADIFRKIENIFQKQSQMSKVDFENIDADRSKFADLPMLIQQETKLDSVETQKRIEEELTGYGPLAVLIADEQITEVLVNASDQVFFEKHGQLFQHEDHFFSEASYLALLDRLSQKCHTYMNREKPFVESQLGNLRVTMIFAELCRGNPLLSIRKQPKSRWTLQQLMQINWCSKNEMDLIQSIIEEKKNFIVVGGTGSGKTSFLQACLLETKSLERNVIIEDTQELQPPNIVSTSLLTRQDPSGSVGDVNMDDLLKRALRLRPDRLVVGEIRGPEARSLLMTMATGHEGSFGSLHARTAHEAILRLEMLVQMGAPQWTLQSIRKLLAMTVQYIIVLHKKDGIRSLEGIYQISSLEENGLTLERLTCRQ